MLNFTPVIRQYAEIFTDMNFTDISKKSPGKDIRDMTSALLSSVGPCLPSGEIDNNGKRLEFFIFTALSSNFLIFLKGYNAVSSRREQKSIMDSLVLESTDMLTDKDDELPTAEMTEYVKTLFVSNLELVTSELAQDNDSGPASLKGLCKYICDYVEYICGVASDTHMRRRVENIIQTWN